jgi:uncharacterized membrane protein
VSGSPILVVHICGGVLGCFSGAAALILRKGSRAHSLAGRVFVATMLIMAVAGVYLAVAKSRPGDVLGGTLTLYLVATSWVTAKRRNGTPGIFDWCALVAVFALVSLTATWAAEAFKSPTGMKNGYPPGPFLFLGSVALIAMIGDVRVLVKGEISGVRRIARHLWRMCFALFIASASIFLARQRLFPGIMRTSGALYVLSFLPLVLMIFWLYRVRGTRALAANWGTMPYSPLLSATGGEYSMQSEGKDRH